MVVRGHDYKHDLRALRAYIREYQPVLIAVDGGADALLDDELQARHHHRRLRLALPIARCTAAPSSCTTCIPTGARPGARSCERAGVHYDEFVAEGMSEDAAMLLAYEAGADADRRGRHARDDGRVPRQGPAGHGVDVPHPLAARAGARRRQGREPPLRGPHPPARHGVPRRVGGCRDGRDGLRVAFAPRVPRRLPAGVRRRVVAGRGWF